MKFLIAEDERFTRLLLVRHLRSSMPAPIFREPKLVSVSDGRAALAELQSNSFDVVFADLRMPELNGLELLQAVRSGQAGPRSNLSFVMVTGEQDETARAGSEIIFLPAKLFHRPLFNLP